MSTKKIFLTFLVILISLGLSAKGRPFTVTVENQPGHVQGVAFDKKAGKLYYSFTTRFIVTDLKGRIVGSVDKIHGHLGAMTFDPVGRKVYASLECKDDAIGAAISRKLGEDGFKTSSFYIAEIDVDKIKTLAVDEKEVIKRIDVVPANEDYAAKVLCGGKELEHRYACSGIDGMTIGPAFGNPEGQEKFLFVAYGIYGDVNRTDNDYQVLLRYPLGKWDVTPERYFVKTGNTNWGVQNLAYDAYSNLMLLAVYTGKKEQYPNYSHFAIDMAAKPVMAKLEGVPYQKGKVQTLPLARRGWNFKHGATGMCPLGDGYWYLAENTRKKYADGSKTFGTKTRLYKWVGGVETLFYKVDNVKGVNWTKGPLWLENAVIYQVYPSSFKDSDGNGIGDIPGIISKLDYIASLGISVLWFNPIFESGWIDGGYDIKNFYKVDPRFGTNTDLVNLAKECHKRGIKIMLDLVPGHTSIDHPWFKQSMEADAHQQYGDYYIWSDRLPDKKAEQALQEMLASDNVMQNTKGKWMVSDAPRGKYYMKNFYACQPALNFGYAKPNPENPWEQGVDSPGPKAVKQELKNIISFWYGKGIDGFRVDMASSLIKNDKDKKGITAFWREIRKWMDENYPKHVLMAEWGDPKTCLAAGFNVDMYLNGANKNNSVRRMYFDWKHQANGGAYFTLNAGKPSTCDLYGNPWPEDRIDNADTPEKMLGRYYDYYGEMTDRCRTLGYFATITGNHDHLRLNTGDRNTPDQLKVMMTWVLTQQLPILYYGDEIGIRSLVELPNVEGANHNGKERAGGRTPMQWDGSANAGFSNCAPEKLYLPVCPEWTASTSYPQYLKWKEEGCKNPVAKGAITVESQDSDPASLLNWTRSLIKLRKENKAFWGSSKWIPIYTPGHAYPMVYIRNYGDQTFLIALNPTAAKQNVTIRKQCSGKVQVVLQSGNASYKSSAKADVISMGPVSALIVKL